MYRYLVMIWDSSSSQQSAAVKPIVSRLSRASSGWNTIVNAGGVLAVHTTERVSDDAYLLDNQAGVVLGTLFQRESDGSSSLSLKSFGESESTAIARSGGRRLIDAYWGRYVAVIRQPNQRRTYVLRDPSGLLPCYWTTCHGVHLFFSHVEDCVQLRAFPLSLNWRNVQAIGAGLLFQTGETTLNEVSELRAGEAAEIFNDRIQTLFYWNPVDVATSAIIEDPIEATRALRRTVTDCTHAWVSRHQRVLHNLSGGLDSSIVLSCLRRAPTAPQVTCINHYTTAAEGDERRFARLTAMQCDCELVEHWADAASVDLGRAFSVSRSMMPAHYLLELLHGEFESELSRSKAATAFFQGGGGDGVFLQSGAEHAPADYVQLHGIRSRLLSVVHDTAKIRRLSMWLLLYWAILNGMRRPRWTLNLGELIGTTFLSTDTADWLAAHNDSFVPTSLREAEHVPDGKRWHIFVSSFPPTFSRPFKRFERPEIMFPLLSQPIHELCLRMPTYVLFHGGWDRAVARRAFAKDLPAEVARRRGKGGADVLLDSILDANLCLLRECLLEGELVRHGIVRKDRLEIALSGKSDRHAVCGDLISLFETEVFLQSWRGLRQEAGPQEVVNVG